MGKAEMANMRQELVGWKPEVGIPEMANLREGTHRIATQGSTD